MTKVSATEAARQFSEIINRVKYLGQSFEVVRGNEIVARITPADPVSGMQLGQLKEFIELLPSMSLEESLSFEDDLKRIRKEMDTPEDSQWD